MARKRRSDRGLVYSTDVGRICPDCRRAIAECRCREKALRAPAGDGVVRVGRQTKGRKGKGVTVITGLPLPSDELDKLARDLKKKCGSGGTVRDGAIEIQGEHRDALVEELSRRGFTVRRSGG